MTVARVVPRYTGYAGSEHPPFANLGVDFDSKGYISLGSFSSLLYSC